MDLHITLGKPGSCPGKPTLAIHIFDNSGSVTGGNDPIGNRFVEAKYALDAVSRRCRCNQELAAVIHFDTPTSRDVEPSPISRKGRDAIARGLAIPSDGAGCSELRKSLHKAYRLTKDYPDHFISLIVFSDFELFDSNLPKLYDELLNFPGIVHAIVLRSSVPTEFEDDERIHVTQISYGSATGVVARAMFESLTTYRPHRELAHS